MTEAGLQEIEAKVRLLDPGKLRQIIRGIMLPDTVAFVEWTCEVIPALIAEVRRLQAEVKALMTVTGIGMKLAVEAERERCAKVAEGLLGDPSDESRRVGAAIRALKDEQS